MLRRENKSFRYFANDADVASKDDADADVDADILGGVVNTDADDDVIGREDKEEDQRLEDLIEQATQEFRSYLKNQVWSIGLSSTSYTAISSQT